MVRSSEHSNGNTPSIEHLTAIMPSSTSPGETRVAVIGAGPQGLCALKNLLEEGFDATLLEARDQIGGIWAFSEDVEDYTIIESTRLIISKLRNCYGDFPYPEGFPMFSTGKEFLDYLEAYADHFNLKERIVFKKRVADLKRVHDGQREGWNLTVEDVASGSKSEQHYDKVMVAVGRQRTPSMPVIEGVEKFGGRIIHAGHYKRPTGYEGKDVIVLGFASTAADIATSLVGVARNIYVAHRRGIIVLPTHVNGRPLDQGLNRRSGWIMGWLATLLPAWAVSFRNRMVLKISDSAFQQKPEWNFKPAADILTMKTMISDTFMPALHSGSIQSTANVKRIVDESTVELEDGTRLHADTIICCTGLKPSTAFFKGLVDVIEVPMPKESQPEKLPRLYQNIFPTRYGTSLAFLDNWQLPTGICDSSELVTTAVVQIFKGTSKLPSASAMNKEIDNHHAWLRKVGMLPNEAKSARVIVREEKWRAWLNNAAGNGLNEYLGWGWRGWWFWLWNRKFCHLLMTGVDSPLIQRLFPGRRKRWDGAREAIEKVNEEYERWKAQQAKKDA